MAQRPELVKGSRLIVLAAICIVVAALWFMQDVLIPLALAVMVSFVLAPVAKRVERTGIGRVGAVIVVVTTCLLVIVIMGTIVTRQVVAFADHLPDYRDNLVSKLKVIRSAASGGALDKAARTIKEAQTAVEEPATTQPTTTTTAERKLGIDKPPEVPIDPPLSSNQEAAERAADEPLPGMSEDKPLWTISLPKPKSALERLMSNIGLFLEPIGIAGLVIVFVIFILIQREDLRDRLIRLLGHGDGGLNVTTSALNDAAGRISRYLLAQAVINGTYGFGVAIALWIIGMVMGKDAAGDPAQFPNFVLWGLLCAVLRFIPYIGPWIAAAFPIAVSFAVYNGYGVFIATTLMFIVIELFSNNVMEPWLYGSSTGMSTIAVLVSAVFWTFLWGPVGLLLATPLTVCLVVLGKYVPQLQFLDILLGDEPVLEPPARLYQRLLAMDQEEATELAHTFLKQTSLERVYDEVLLPALAMAEQDRHKGSLDDDRSAFVMQAIRDMIEELGDAARANEERRASSDVREAAAANVALARGQVPVVSTQAPATAGGVTGAGPGGNGAAAPTLPARFTLPTGCKINVLCLPARDEGDDVANVMLAQLLALHGYCAHPIAVAALASEMVDAIEKHGADIVVVSALPPGAVSGSRYLCKRVHARYADLPMAIGLWTIKGDLKKAKDRLTCSTTVQVATTFTAMLDVIQQLAQPVIAKQAAAPAAATTNG